MSKKISTVLLLVFALMTFSACKGQSAAERDVLASSKESNQIIWGVKNDTRLFGLMDIDAIIATMTITDERKKQVDFSDVYFDAGQSLLVAKDSPIQGIEDLNANTTVLVVKGSTSAINIRKAAPEAKILELENYAEAFTALQSGQGDAMTTDNAILLGMASENPNYHLVGGTFTNEPYGIAIDKGQEPFLKAVNQALKEMHEDGTYDEIYQKWFPDDASGKVD